MRVTIDRHGVLKIEAQTPLEAYALGKWCGDNLVDGVLTTTEFFLLDWSLRAYQPTNSED